MSELTLWLIVPLTSLLFYGLNILLIKVTFHMAILVFLVALDLSLLLFHSLGDCIALFKIKAHPQRLVFRSS